MLDNGGVRFQIGLRELPPLILAFLILNISKMYLGADVLVCPFARYFGIVCPGCGSMTALSKFLDLDFRSAFESNPLFVISPIFVACGIALRSKGRTLYRLYISICIVLVIFVTLLRNLT